MHNVPLTKERPHIVMIGAFPPPTHGMAVINQAILNNLRSAGAILLVIDLAAPCITKRFLVLTKRLTKVLFAIVRLASTRRLRNKKLYIGVSGGLGQIYEIFFALLARLRGMHLYLHHHSYAYLSVRKLYTQFLIKFAGSSSTHVVLSEGMEKQLQLLYEPMKTISISNVVFNNRKEPVWRKSYQKPRTLGFISNITAEKGVFEFIDLMHALKVEKTPLKALLAGPFIDPKVEDAVYRRLAQLQEVEYVGPKYGVDKDYFFDQIDVLIFPTHYVHEAEPLIVLEAMSCGVPIIAYGRGCIPEIVGSDCGKIVDTREAFVKVAFEQIKLWLQNPTLYESASRATAHRFLENYVQNSKKWQKLLANLLGDSLYAESSGYNKTHFPWIMEDKKG